MSSDKPKTPNKAELLNELESIRDFLDNDAEGDIIPTLTTVASTARPTQAPEHDDSPMADHASDESALKEAYQHELGVSPEDISESESSPHSEAAEEEPSNSPNQDDPNQDSLFDTPPVKNLGKAKQHFDTTEHSNTNMPKARGENPFLPPHIRERLGRHKELFESVPEDIARAMALKARVEVQGDLLSGFDHQEPHHNEPKAEPDNKQANASPSAETLIDALVDEYLPQIEAKLRAKLREASLKYDK